MRAKANCSLSLLKAEAKFLAKNKSKSLSEIHIDYGPVEKALERALDYFSTDDCNWGKGLTLFQLGLLFEAQEYHSEAEKNFKAAKTEFNEVNHYRGLALCNKHLSSLTKSKDPPNEALVRIYQKDHTENIVRWRTAHTIFQEYLSINRAWGEDFSLITEIVLLNSK